MAIRSALEIVLVSRRIPVQGGVEEGGGIALRHLQDECKGAVSVRHNHASWSAIRKEAVQHSLAQDHTDLQGRGPFQDHIGAGGSVPKGDRWTLADLRAVRPLRGVRFHMRPEAPSAPGGR